MLNITDPDINAFLTNELVKKNEEITIPSLYKWNNGKYGIFTTKKALKRNGEIYRCVFDEFEYYYDDKENCVNYTRLQEQDKNDKGRGFIVGFLKIRCMDSMPETLRKNLIDFYKQHNIPLNTLDVKIHTIDDVFHYYYNEVRRCNYQLFSNKDFKKHFLQKENEYYLYTKDRLFPFFREDARRLLTIFTREFFEYAREQGCVGEFVEDVKDEVVNNVIVDEMDVKLEKVNRIINLLNKEWIIGIKRHIPFNLIDTGIIYSSIVEFVKNDKLEIRYTIETNKKSSQHRNFALKYCTKILFPTDENNENWWIFLSKLFKVKLESIKKSIREANPEKDFQKAVEDIFKD